jgi:hypothetical protein
LPMELLIAADRSVALSVAQLKRNWQPNRLI